MNVKVVLNVVSALVVVVGVAILSSVPVSMLMGDSSYSTGMLALSALVAILFGVVGYFYSKVKYYDLGVREGFGIVTFGWIAASIFGAVPFVLAADMYWYDAFFETMSGFSTTGSSVLDSKLLLTNGETLQFGIKDLPKGLLYWRSVTHWLGGMGIVVLSLAIIPFLGIGGQRLYNAEVPGPTSDQLTPKIANSAKILWGVYVLLTVVEVTLLYFGGMSLFDSWCHACGTMATGGFSTSQASVGGFDSLYIDMVITLFMFLSGCNFVLHYRALRGKPLFYFKDEEFKFYFLITIGATIVIAIGLIGNDITTTTGAVVPGTIVNAFRYSSFQVVSILTTTGFCTADFDQWATYSKIILVTYMFIGGCGGSTGGGMKNSRLLLLLKYGVFQVRRCLFPREISNIRLSGERIGGVTLHKVLGFSFLFISLFLVFALLLSFIDNMDFTTAISASIACLGNIGPGLEGVGATCSYSWMSPPAKLLLTVSMLLGRLELYTVLVVFLPTFWKK